MKELTGDRAQEFQNLFPTASFQIPKGYFERSSSRQPLFIRHCNKILDAFSRRWHPAESLKNYLTTFSLSTWRALSDVEKSKHTLSNCSACAVQFKNLQEQFPMKPYHTVTQIEDLYSSSSTSKKSERETTRQVLQTVNNFHSMKFGTSIVESAIKLCPEEKLQRKSTPNERRHEKRKFMRKIRDQENELLARNTMKAVYTENESLSGYNRKRKAICFETSTTPKRNKCHTPKLDDVSWNKRSSSESFRLGQPIHSSTGVRLQESIKFLVEIEVRLQKNLLE